MVGLYQLCTSVRPRRFPSVEKRDKPSLTYISLKNSLHLRFPSKCDVYLAGTLIFYPNARSLATFLKAVVYDVKH